MSRGARNVSAACQRRESTVRLRGRLRVRERSEFGGGARAMAAVSLPAWKQEVRSIAPRERTAETDTGLDRGVVHDVDRAFVVPGVPVAREACRSPLAAKTAVTPNLAIASAFFRPSSVSIIGSACVDVVADRVAVAAGDAAQTAGSNA